MLPGTKLWPVTATFGLSADPPDALIDAVCDVVGHGFAVGLGVACEVGVGAGLDLGVDVGRGVEPEDGVEPGRGLEPGVDEPAALGVVPGVALATGVGEARATSPETTRSPVSLGHELLQHSRMW